MNNFQTQFLHLMNRLLENSERSIEVNTALLEEIQLLRADFQALGQGANVATLLKNLFLRSRQKGR